MELSSDFITHFHDVPRRCPSRPAEVAAVADCPCGIAEWHTHCKSCGRVIARHIGTGNRDVTVAAEERPERWRNMTDMQVGKCGCFLRAVVKGNALEFPLIHCPLHAAASDLLAALKQLADSPAVFKDPRVSYVELQVDTYKLDDAAAAIAKAALPSSRIETPNKEGAKR